MKLVGTCPNETARNEKDRNEAIKQNKHHDVQNKRPNDRVEYRYRSEKIENRTEIKICRDE